MKKFDWEGFRNSVNNNPTDNDLVRAANSQGSGYTRGVITTQGHNGELAIATGGGAPFYINRDGEFWGGSGRAVNAHKYLEVMGKWFNK